jgi:putative MATE family efflux protein
MRRIKKHKKAPGLWKDILEAIAGTKQDFTRINLSRAILLLSIPMVLEMVMESIFAVADIFFVSKIGSDAVAAVGITESMLAIVYSIGAGLSTATTAVISRRIGEKNPEGAAIATIQAIAVTFVISLFISISGILLAPTLLKLMGASPSIIEAGYTYTAIMIGGNSVIILLFVINAVFRSAGDAATSMRVLWLANILNIILDPCLIFGYGPFPELGVTGAAIATNIGRGIGVLCQFILLSRGKGRVRIKRNHITLDFGVMKRLLHLSLGGIGQSIIATSSWIGLVRIIAIFGSGVLAGYTIAIRIIMFFLLPSWGLSNAAATLVGQNLGAKRVERAERAVWITGFINMSLLGVIAIFFILFPGFFIRLFIGEANVVASGAVCLRIVSYGFLFYAFGMVMVQAFNGAGDTTTPTRINFFCFWMLEIPLAWFLALPSGLEEKGVYAAIVFSETIMTVVSILLFRRGQWKTRKV